MGNDYASKKLVGQLLVPVVGKKVMDLGEDLQKVPAFDLIVNSLILGNLELLAGVFTFAIKAGIDNRSASNDFFPAPSLIVYADKMAHEKGFNTNGGIKDAAHIRRLTEKHNCPMPVVDIVHQHLLAACAKHEKIKQDGIATFEQLDRSGIIADTRSAAGLLGFDRSEDTSVSREDQDCSHT